MSERSFLGIWIPREIWLSNELSLQEKVFLVEIQSLDKIGSCFASNAHFSDFFKISKSRVSQVIKSLEEKELICIEYEREGKQIKKRIIKVVDNLNTPFRKLDGGGKFSKHPPLGNAEGINTGINNTEESEKEFSLIPLEGVERRFTRKELKNKKISELKIEIIPGADELYFQYAVLFQQMFMNNLQELNIPTNNVEQAKYNWVNDMRMILTTDRYTRSHLMDVFAYLQKPCFWRDKVQSVPKLREKMQRLVTDARSQGKTNPSSITEMFKEGENGKIEMDDKVYKEMFPDQ